MNEKLISRNFQALSQGLKDQREEISKIKEESKRKDAIIAEQNTRLNLMQQQVSILFAKTMGTGATS